VDTTKDTDFNVAGIRVLYNGLVSKEHPVTDHAFNYVIAFELGSQCSNLSGVLKIAYRYSDSLTPANQPYNRAAPMPLFSR
jgi:predicted metalloprotease